METFGNDSPLIGSVDAEANASPLVGVVGLGHVGKPLVRACLESGFRVIGIDKSPDLLEALRTEFADSRTGFLSLSLDKSLLSLADIIVICVPTPMSGDFDPDYSLVEQAAMEIGAILSPGQLVILESTVGPGTTLGLFKSALETVSGLSAESDFFLAYSPERVDPSNSSFSIRNTPKIVAGHGPEALTRATDFYKKFVDQVIISPGVSEAEAAKLLENTYRHINIALANEFGQACLALGLDSRAVIGLASTKPFGFQAFYPSPGAGGHCIPVDPNFLQRTLTDAGFAGLSLIESSNAVNEARPSTVAKQIREFCQNHSVPVEKALILGLTYKADVSDFRESKQLELVKALVGLDFELAVHDFSPLTGIKHDLRVVSDLELEGEIARSDIVILLQSHTRYFNQGHISIAKNKLINCTSLDIPDAMVQI